LIELCLALSFRLRLISVHVRDGRFSIPGPFVEGWLRFRRTVVPALPRPGDLDLQPGLADLAIGFGCRVNALGTWCRLVLDRISGENALLLFACRTRRRLLDACGRLGLGLGFLRRNEPLRGSLRRHCFRLDGRGAPLDLLGRRLGLGFH
jgi:hypothetical protein